jgi:large conductance mechanosensitive channel
MGMIQEFKDFLAEYKVMGLAVAFIIGGAVTTLVQSFVNQLIMPVIGAALPNGNWQTAVLNLGGVKLGWGAFLSALLNFIIIALVVFMIAKFVINEGKVAKK